MEEGSEAEENDGRQRVRVENAHGAQLKTGLCGKKVFIQGVLPLELRLIHSGPQTFTRLKQPFTTPPVSQVLRTAFGFLQAVNVLLWIYANMSMRFGLLRGIKDLYIRPHVPGELPYLGAF